MKFTDCLLAKKYHPDVGGDTADTEKFKEIVKAYETLSNTNKRKIYDLSLTDARFSQEAYDSGDINAGYVNKRGTEFYQNK